ncbi:MAG: glutamyl-tRNA reductase [Armatimonadetes bacterium]|nr:glutamyl-tRNA reductase [Armatimonadota bacterium]
MLETGQGSYLKAGQGSAQTVVDRLVVVGASFQTADLSVRCSLAITQSCLEPFLLDLQAQGVEECFALSTCNRVEVYALTDRVEVVLESLSKRCGMPVGSMREHLYIHRGEATVRHLLEVVSGLDSAVLGETEIVSQVKGAWNDGSRVGAVRPVMDELLRRAFETGKRVRTETDISRAVTSVASLAMREASKAAQGLEDKNVLVIGAGQVAERVMKYLADHRPAKTVVLNRTPEKAERLAAGIDAEFGGLNDLQPRLDEADVVISAVGAEAPIVTRAMIEACGPKSRLFVDLGVPNNFEQGVDQLPGATLLHVEHLTEVCRKNSERRAKAVPQAQAIIEQETARAVQSLRERAASGTIRELIEHGETVKRYTLEQMEPKLRRLGESERALVEEAARRVVNGMLQGPIQELKGSDDPSATETAVRALYGLEEDDD